MLKADLQEQAALLQSERDSTIQEVSTIVASAMPSCTNCYFDYALLGTACTHTDSGPGKYTYIP